MRVLIYGINGKMGKIIFECLKETKGVEATCGVDKYINPVEFDIPTYYECKEVDVDVDVLIDFSVTAGLYDYLPFAIEKKIPCVIATTGFNDKEQEMIKQASAIIPIFQSGNMSLGINVLLKLAMQGAKLLEGKADIEIIEHHHNRKVDAPSGTALLLANGIKEVLPESTYIYGREGHTGKRGTDEIGIHAVRGGTIAGKHEVLLIMNNEVITLKHEAENRIIFAQGAIKAAKYLISQEAGLYNMNSMLG